MPTLYFIDFEGNITQAEGVEQANAYSVADGPKAGVYPKLRQNRQGKQGFFLSWGAAREAALDILDAVIARAEREVELLKQKQQQLDEAAPPGEAV